MRRDRGAKEHTGLPRKPELFLQPQPVKRQPAVPQEELSPLPQLLRQRVDEVVHGAAHLQPDGRGKHQLRALLAILALQPAEAEGLQLPLARRKPGSRNSVNRASQQEYRKLCSRC